MHLPEGTVLARAKREGWTQQIATNPVSIKMLGPITEAASFTH
jgi:hypothetical protein